MTAISFDCNLTPFDCNSSGQVADVQAKYLGFSSPVSGIVKGQINSALSAAFGPNKGVPGDTIQSLLDTLNKNETGLCYNLSVTVTKP